MLMGDTMKMRELFWLSFLLSLWGVVLGEGLYYGNFTPFSVVKLFRILPIRYLYAFLLAWVSLFFFMYLLAFFILLFSPLYSHLRYQFVHCGILFIISNFALSFVPEIFQQMNFVSEIALFTWIIFVFYTFFYSIFYRNLIK